MPKILVKKQITIGDIEVYRKQMSAAQKYKCPICDGSLAWGRGALDHCHDNGSIRAVLCTSCNVSEGKVKAGMLFRTPIGNMARTDPVIWLRNLADYLEKHKKTPTGIIHPTFDLKTCKQRPTSTRRAPTKRTVRRTTKK